jgi:hypothetical protein
MVVENVSWSMAMLGGLLINQFGNLLFSLGMNLLKLHHLKANNPHHNSNIQNHHQDDDDHSPLLEDSTSTPNTSPWGWILPAISISIGGVFVLISFAFAPQSILAALSSTQFLFNLIFKVKLFHDHLNKIEILATLIIIIGDILIVLSSSFNSKDSFQLDSVSDVEALITNRIYIIYLIVVTSFSVVFHVVFSILNSEKRNCLSKSSAMRSLAPVFYAATSAMLGSLGMVMAKSLSEMARILLTKQSTVTFSDPVPFFFLIGLIVSISFWMFRVNGALKIFSDNGAIIPILQVCWLLFCIVGGGIYFQEFAKMHESQLSIFSVGAITIISGVVMLASATPPPSSQIPTAGRHFRRSSSEIFFTLPISPQDQ